jgi:gliding motility-associated-like protein/uncharacterized repeat protein (TIGR01451 family)
MLLTTLFQRKVEWYFCAVIIGSLFFQLNLQAQSVPIYATTISSQSNTDLSANAIDGNLSTKASVRASSGILVGIGAYSGHLELQFPSTLPANTTSFVKIQTDDNLLPSLLGGSLGGLLSDVVGTVLIGNQEFTVEAKNGATPVLEGNSQITNDFAVPRLRIVVNAGNEYFIAITPSQPYNRIRLSNRLGSLVGLNNTKRLDVYEAFYIGTPDICGGASYTSFEGSGLSLDLLNLGGAGVANPNYVLDSNPNNFSKLSMGILGVAASIEQTVYFDGTSQPTDQFFIKMKVDPSLLTLGVLNNIHIVASNGPNVIQTANLNSLLNLDLLTLLQGNQAVTIPFSPNGTVNRITVRYNSLLNVNITQSLDLYEITRAPAKPVITDLFTLNPIICSGSTASLVATTGSGTELNWYSQAQGGSPLATTNSNQPFITPALTANTSFYVAAKRTGCPEESLRVKVDATVINLPVASDIVISSLLDACNGSITLSPVSLIGGAVFKYYKDQAKTQEITTGFSGDAGVTYTKNSATGALEIFGLTAVNSPYAYYISLTVDGLCENEANNLKAVTVNYTSALNLNVADIEGCGSVDLKDAIVNFDNSSDIQYNFYNSSNVLLTAEAATSIQASGTYYIQAISLSGSCSSAMQQVTVTVSPETTLIINNGNLVVNLGTSVTLDAISNAPITWYGPDGNALASNTFGPFTAAGFYTFTAIAINGICSASGNIFVTVIDPADCPALTERVYANTQSWSSIITGGVTNANASIDQNPQTFSTITTGIGLLGIGTTWQTLQWNQTISAGTPVTVKLGSQYSGLIVAGAYSVIGTKRNGSGIPVDIGQIQPVSGSLADLLPGENTFEFTFVPSDNSGPKIYDGIRIIVGSLVSLAQNVKVYEAWYDKQVTQTACSPEDVEDIFSGAVDLGVGVATATVGVDNPFNAVDTDIDSYATMYSGAGILAAADLTVSFRTPTLTSDSTEIIVSRPTSVLDLNLLAGFSIQLYMGNSPIGAPILNTSSLLNLTLLNGGASARIKILPQTQIYDRIKIRFGGVAGVLDLLRIHDIKRKADTSIIDADPTNTIHVCQNQTIQLVVQPEACTTFIWYDAAIGGNIVSTGNTYTVPQTLAAGTYTYYIQPVRFGCEVYERGAVTIIVGNTAPPTAITNIQVNGGATTTFCAESGDIILTASLNSTMTITNPIFYWYAFDGTNMQPIPNQSTATLTLSNLAAGTYTYYVGVSSDEYCATAPGDRATVTITILPFSQPADINAPNILICQSIAGILTPTSTLPNPQFFWFFANNNTQPIISGSVIGGVTYTISAAGVLTVSGLTITNSPYTYYVGMTSDASCLNQDGNFKVVTITVNDSGTPTTIDNTQDFCLSENPTVASIQVNEPNVIWYDVIAGGTALLPTTPLTNGAIYYAGFDASTGCGSAVRLAVTVTINNAPTPTTLDNTQDFCRINNPTVANIQVNEANVNWYLAPNGGTALLSTTALINGTTYFATLTDASSGCESAVRLAVAVNINDADTPTTTSSEQNFCLIDNPTIANIQVNEPNITWYSAANAGTALLTTALLVNNATYYASMTDAVSGCESSIRLAVTVHVNDAPTPTTTNATQNFCVIDSPTVADIQVNESNINWYSQLVGGTQLALTDALSTGIYYATLTDGNGCESTIRLAVAVNINNAPTPTTTSANQSFCISLNPTIASIQVNETNVIWYNAPTGGTQLLLTDLLFDGGIYYASQSVNGCESSIRLAVTVNITDVGTPTTNNLTQAFCLINHPTVANIQVNGTGIVWYNQPTGGTPFAATDLLANGTYYASFEGLVLCSSIIRLAVSVTVNDALTPTATDDSQEFCLTAVPTIASIQVNESNVVWYTASTGGTALPTSTILTAGTYYAAAVDAITGCESSIRLAVTVSFLGSLPASIEGGDITACASQQVTYTTEAGHANYVWAIVGGNIIAGGQTTDNTVTVLWTTVGAASVTVSYPNNCNIVTSAIFQLTVNACSDIMITKTVSNPSPTVDDNVIFTITVSNVGTTQFANVNISESLPSGYQFVSITATAGTFSESNGVWNIPQLNANETISMVITAKVQSRGDYMNVVTVTGSTPPDSDLTNNSASAFVVPTCLVIYNEFSPNTDGHNDVFRIDCIENYPNNKFEVYNRYGALVYQQNHYANNWDGTANVSGAINKDDKLPSGTYYYILNAGVDNIVKTGWLSITR